MKVTEIVLSVTCTQSETVIKKPIIVVINDIMKVRTSVVLHFTTQNWDVNDWGLFI